MLNLAMKVKEGTVSADEIAQLVAFAKESGGIEYAEKKMLELHILNSCVESQNPGKLSTHLIFLRCRHSQK